MEARSKRVLLLLADISGYTRFMLSHGKALAHSQMIIGGLLETLMKQIDHPLEVVELEGDALFLYSPKTEEEAAWGTRSQHLLDTIHRLFHIFDQRLAEFAAYSICHCEACGRIGDLELKVVAHSGEALLSQVGQFPVVAGPDVIVVHRLLKNSLPADRYVLMTEAAYHDLPVPKDVQVLMGTEEYDIGTFKTFHYVPEASSFDDESIRGSFSDDNVAVKILRHEVQREYTEVACEPGRGYHFNTGHAAMEKTEYDPGWTEGVPEEVLESFAGTGNPFAMGELEPGEHVVDIGSGAGLDCMIAAQMVGADGHVIGVEMTPAMIEKARAAAAGSFDQVEFREGFIESLPVSDGWADVVISNAAVNLSPDKSRVFSEMYRILRPGGRLQIADIIVAKAVPEGAKRNIDLWTN